MAGDAKRCQVCTHPSRLAIEQAILNAKPKSAIARDFGFTYTRSSDGATMPNHKAIARHAGRCMANAYERAVANQENKSGEQIVKRLEQLDEEVDRVIEAARKGFPVMVGDVPLLDDEGRQVMRHDWRLLLAAVREGRANAELVAKLAGKVEGDAGDLEAARRHLESPEARRLLQELERLQAAEDARQDQAGS